MINEVGKRVSAAILGLAIGEAMSWTSLFQRLRSLPDWVSRIRRDIETHSEVDGVTSFPMPFSLNQSASSLKISPGDLTEWAAWVAQILLEHQGVINQEILHIAWLEMVENSDKISGRISVHAALHNIKRGMTSPQCGRFNPHYFDDAALPRALVIGAVNTGQIDSAIQQAEIDAEFTQYQDGVWCAQALAAAISQACNGVSIEGIISSAIKQLPEDSLSYQTVQRALDKATLTQIDAIDLAVFLSNDICNPEYSYGNISYEILASALAIIVQTKGHFDAALGSSTLIPKAADSLPAIVGALAGAISGQSLENRSWVKNDWRFLKGHSLPALNKTDFLQIVTQLSILANEKYSDSLEG